MSRSKKSSSRPVALTGYLSESMTDDDSEEEVDADDESVRHSDDEQEMDDSGRLRMRPNIDVGPDYAGKRSSRKSAIGVEDSHDEDDGDDDDDLRRKSLNKKLDALYNEGSSDEDDDALRKWQMSSGQDDELEALTREYEKLREQEVDVRESLKDEESEKYRKGQAVQQQKIVWDRALEVRISLQKVLSGANRLPNKRGKVVFSEKNEIKEAYSRLFDSAAATMETLVDLETAMIESNSGIDEVYSSTRNGDRKRSALREPGEETTLDEVDKAWQEVDRAYSRIAPFRNNALDRWQRKIQLNTGAVSKGKLRAFNQSISQQIATSMRDPSRLIDGTRLNRSSIRLLGQTLGTEAQVSKPNTATEVKEEERISDTFDDSEFYQNLLHEFLESSDPTGKAGRDLIAVKKRVKNRKVVDRRASKGRKIRYNVLEPLLNFMAPSPMIVPPMTSKLFKNVFGLPKAEAVLVS